MKKQFLQKVEIIWKKKDFRIFLVFFPLTSREREEKAWFQAPERSWT